MKAVFDTRADSVYDDDIVAQYHFPGMYGDEARAALNDWVIYRTTRRGGAKGDIGYIAVARVIAIEPDDRPGSTNHHYARVADYLPFDRVVPLRRNDLYYEQRLNGMARSLVGRTLQGHSVRTISDAEFGAIVRDGLRDTLDGRNAVRLGLVGPDIDPETRAALDEPEAAQERRIIEFLTNRKIREAYFRNRVLAAYDRTCAVTGLRIINGGGRAEAQAAHIWAVQDGGPDVTTNGIALSGTIHWLFDRHLISLTDDYGLLVSHNKVPTELRGLFDRQMERIRLPTNRSDWPKKSYIRRHREAFAAG